MRTSSSATMYSRAKIIATSWPTTTRRVTYNNGSSRENFSRNTKSVKLFIMFTKGYSIWINVILFIEISNLQIFSSPPKKCLRLLILGSLSSLTSLLKTLVLVAQFIWAQKDYCCTSMDPKLRFGLLASWFTNCFTDKLPFRDVETRRSWSKKFLYLPFSGKEYQPSFEN